MEAQQSQIEREKTLSEIVLRYRDQREQQNKTTELVNQEGKSAKDEKRNQRQMASMASDLLRQEILRWFKPLNHPADGGDPWKTPLANFQFHLSQLCRGLAEETLPAQDLMAPKRTGRPPGAQHAFRHIWLKLGLGLDDKTLHDEGALLFYLTLYTLCKEILAKVGDKEIADAHLLLPANCELVEAKEANEEEDETDENDPIVDNELKKKTDIPSLQEFCGKVWNIIALEFSFRPDIDNKTQSGRTIRTRRSTIAPGAFHITDEIAESFAERKGLDVKKRMEFAGTLINVLVNSFAERWFEIVLVNREEGNRNTRIKVILPTAKLLKQINQLTQETLTLNHQAPLIEPPVDWGQHGIRQGGYHYRHLPFYKFYQKNRKIREFLSQVNQPAWFAEVFAATNALQRTPWRVNQRLWAVVEALYALAKVSLPTQAEKDLFPAPEQAGTDSPRAVKAQLEQLTPAQRNAWRKWLRTGENFYTREQGRPKGPGARNAYRVAISTLLDALGRERIYFAYQADARGRMYPVGSILQPQGDDLNRALLEFADPLPLTPEGIRPLAIYGTQQIKDSSLLAYFHIKDRDKPTLDERVSWIEAHTEQIIRCAADPLQETWWRGGDDDNQPAVSKPFTFLAFCFAWADYQQAGEQAECSLPVHVDGTCNGLQHIAALMRDEELAKATNVLPDSYPRDIYNEIANAVRARMLQPPISTKSSQRTLNTPEHHLWMDNGVIEFLKEFEYLVDRSLAKSVVMIIPYGAGQQNYQQNIYKKLSAKILPKKDNKGYQSNKYAKWIYDWLNLHQWEPKENRSSHSNDTQKPTVSGSISPSVL